MIPVVPPSTWPIQPNAVAGAPQLPVVGDMAVHIGHWTAPGGEQVATWLAWFEPSPAEVAALIAGAPVELQILGTHKVYPVSVIVRVKGDTG